MKRNPYIPGSDRWQAREAALNADAKKRGEVFDDVQSFVRGEQQQPAAPAIDPALIRAARATADPTSSPYAHLAAPSLVGETETRTSDLLAFMRVNGGTDPPAPTGTAGAIVQAGEKRRAGTDAIDTVP